MSDWSKATAGRSGTPLLLATRKRNVVHKSYSHWMGLVTQPLASGKKKAARLTIFAAALLPTNLRMSDLSSTSEVH